MRELAVLHEFLDSLDASVNDNGSSSARYEIWTEWDSFREPYFTTPVSDLQEYCSPQPDTSVQIALLHLVEHLLPVQQSDWRDRILHIRGFRSRLRLNALDGL
ncbi:hypothetical protein R1flu_021176 [Riccia fluitans]|uniref:Uncharacterized protein n=1 Tax=Riccia fluitans TaxID=41844 RepID=A0ABD1ZNL9_9MARC